MKKILTISLCLGLFINISGQVAKVRNLPTYDYKFLHWGFMVGLNTMDFSFHRPAGDSILFADISSPNPGFQVSIISEMRINDWFTLRFLPGITFGAREFSFYDKSDAAVPFNQQTVESNFLDFPLLVKYKSKRVNNYRPYLIGGFSVRYDMAARREIEGMPDIRLKPLDYYLEFGVGIDFFLRYFKFAPELKVSVGMIDVLVHESQSQYVTSIDQVHSYVMMLCFNFE